MTKRTVLASLMLFVGGLTPLSLEGLVFGIPLLAGGAYLFFAHRVPLGRIKETVPAGTRL